MDCAITCTATSCSSHISKVAAVRCYTHALIVGFLKLKSPTGLFFLKLTVHLLLGKKKMSSFSSQSRGGGGSRGRGAGGALTAQINILCSCFSSLQFWWSLWIRGGVKICESHMLHCWVTECCKAAFISSLTAGKLLSGTGERCRVAVYFTSAWPFSINNDTFFGGVFF